VGLACSETSASTSKRLGGSISRTFVPSVPLGRIGRNSEENVLTDEISPGLASYVGGLLLTPQTWIHRRVEQVSYLDPTTVRRRISIDFEIPATRFARNGAGPLYVPIALFAKRLLTGFDLRDSSGRSLAMVTKEENGRLSSAVLLGVARGLAGDLVDSVEEEYIPRLVRAADDEERERAWKRIFQPGTSVGSHLEAQPAFVALASDLALNFVLYLPVQPREAGMRRIVKLGFDSNREELSPAFFARLGWTAAEDAFVVPLAGYSRSYHFELEAPPEMEITRGIFVAASETASGDTRLESNALDSSALRAHFYLAGLARRGGIVVVALRVANREALGAATLLAVANLAVLVFVLRRLEAFRAARTSDAVVAALLVVPGVLIGYITRPANHPVVARFLTGFRFAATVSVATSFVAALVLFAGYSVKTLEAVFSVLAGAALLAAMALGGGWLARWFGLRA
jgi:hypothetical protein